MLTQLIEWLLSGVLDWGYWGIFIMMAIESTFIPLPSELVMVPAGYLIFKGEMNFLPVIASGTLGSVFGAILSYYFGRIAGRKLIQKYGMYFFISTQKLMWVERFFYAHGSLSIFSGRLIPVARHLISIVGGLALMEKWRFSIYTAAGAGIWVTILTQLGYYIGVNESLIKKYISTISLVILAVLIVGWLIYISAYKKRESSSS